MRIKTPFVGNGGGFYQKEEYNYDFKTTKIGTCRIFMFNMIDKCNCNGK